MTNSYVGWRKSRHSEPNGDCIEVVSAADGTIGVRDSKALPQSPILEFTREEWAAFLSHIQTAS